MSKAFTTTLIGIDDIQANPWNPNKQSDFMYQRELESIRMFGFIDPITVREKPGSKKKFEVLDGEHRWRGAKELGLKKLPCINLGKIDDARAQAITDIQNNLNGEDDPVMKARMIAAIIEDDQALRHVLPYGDDQLQSIIEAANFDWNSLPGTSDSSSDSGDGEKGWVGLKISLDPGQHKIVSKAIERSKATLNSKSDAEAVVHICQGFLGHR